jgi:predicted TIM-barrel fold metal-dependent hydrolase
MGGKAPNAYPETGPAGSSLAKLQEQILEKGNRERAVLAHDEALLTAAYYNRYAANAVVKAVNDWTAEEWLARDPRLFGTILIVSQMPDEAAAEIRRSARNERFVAVTLGANMLSNVFGHPVYDPIYKAAAETGLPVVLQVGSDLAASSLTPPIGGGLPTTFAEYRALGAHATMSHLTSMIYEGIFEEYRDLKLLLVGGGATWIPGFLWRMNYWYKMGKDELPSAKAFPIDYFRDHVRVATYGIESPQRPERLAQALSTLPWINSTLVYGSGFPNSDYEEPESISARLPEAWHPQVFHANAAELFRWPATVPA